MSSSTLPGMAEPPLCAGPDPAPRRPKVRLPPLACDCHAHIAGPKSVYPYSPRRIYTPPDALLPAYLGMLGVLGVERAVLIQPSVYGTDNRAMLDAMAKAGDRFRGVAVVDDAVPDAELEKMHAAGVRGVRINVVDVAEDKGVIPMASLRRLAERIKPLGWHVEFLMHADEFPDLDAQFADFPVDIVLGHLGYMRTDKGLGAPGFQALLRLMRSRALLGQAHRAVPDFNRRDALSRRHAVRARADRCGATTRDLGNRLAARDGEKRDAERRRAVRPAARLGAGRNHPPQGAGGQSGETL